MKRIAKKIISGLLCVAMLTGLTGCGAKETGTGTTDSAPETVPKATQEEANEVTAMGRYVESVIELPEGASYPGRTMALLDDGRWAYLDGSIGMYTSSDEGASWTPGQKIDNLTAGGGFISSGAISPDGSFSLCLVTGGIEGGLNATIVYVGQDGSVKEFSGNAGEGNYMNRIFAGEGKELYGLTSGREVYRIDPEKGDITKLFDATEVTEMLAVSGNKLMALERNGVEIYDLEQGMLLEADSVLNSFIAENVADHIGNSADSMGGILLPGEDGSVYTASRVGVYRHVLNGNAMEQLIDGAYSSFGDPMTAMNAMIRLDSEEFLLLTSDSLIRFTYDADKPSVPEKQLKVYSLRDSDRIRQIASQFQKDHTDVFVRYEYGLEEGTGMTTSDALKNLNVELMSGNGPDVIVMDGMDENVYADKGMLRDLTPLLDELTEQGTVYENILKPYRTETGTFVLPAIFQLPLIYGKTEDLAQIHDLQSLADFVIKAHEENPERQVIAYVNAKEMLSQLMLVEGSGLIHGKELDIEALTELLTQAKRLYDPNMENMPPEYKEWDIDTARIFAGPSTDVVLGVARVATGLAGGVVRDLGMVGSVEGKGYEFDLWAGSQGKGFMPENKLAVTANASQPELAEEFVRLAFSFDMQKVNWGDGFPVNREAFDEMCKEDQNLFIGGSFTLYGIERETTYEYPGAETVDRLKELVSQAEQSLEGNAILEEAVKEYGAPALTGETSVEKAVEAIRKKVGIYLAE